jgi:hypothetical protein
MHLFKSKILAIPKGIFWDRSKTTKVSLSKCGLKFKASPEWLFAIATKGYDIFGEHCRKKNFIGFYYEVTTSR